MQTFQQKIIMLGSFSYVLRAQVNISYKTNITINHFLSFQYFHRQHSISQLYFLLNTHLGGKFQFQILNCNFSSIYIIHSFNTPLF